MPAMPPIPPIPPIDVHVDVPPMPPVMAFMHGYEGHAHCFADGDAYAIVGDPGTETRFCGNTSGEMEAEIDKARDRDSWTFPALPPRRQVLHRRRSRNGEPDRAHGKVRTRSRRANARARVSSSAIPADRFATKHATRRAKPAAAIPAPDLSKEMADLNASVANLDGPSKAPPSRGRNCNRYSARFPSSSAA